MFHKGIGTTRSNGEWAASYPAVNVRREGHATTPEEVRHVVTRHTECAYNAHEGGTAPGLVSSPMHENRTGIERHAQWSAAERHKAYIDAGSVAERQMGTGI